jgi:hypothetical protein
VDIKALIQEFEPIRAAIARTRSEDKFLLSPMSDSESEDPAAIDRAAVANFCRDTAQMLREAGSFPDAERYAWTADPQHFENSFEAWGQLLVIKFVISLWEYKGYRCERTIILRGENTGGFHIETYGTANAYFLVASYQFINLANRYSLLNHQLITLGEAAGPGDSMTPTNFVCGQSIERALRGRWQDCGPWLEDFVMSVLNAIDFRDSFVLLTEHIAAESRQRFSSEEYAHLRGAEPPDGIYLLPPELIWTRYTDFIMWFTISHELIHISNGDIEKPGRSVEEEFRADEGALEIIAFMLIGLARRSGHSHAESRQLIICPAIFFGVSRLFAFLDSVASKDSFEIASRELVMLSRRINRAARLFDQYRIAPGGSFFWSVMGELRTLEVAARRWIWSFSHNGEADPEAVDQEIRDELEIVEREKRHSERMREMERYS